MWWNRPDARLVLKDEMARKALGRYFSILQHRGISKSLISKKISSGHTADDSLSDLWKEHEKLTREYHALERKIDNRELSIDDFRDQESSYIDLKKEILKKILSSCELCERRCRVNRLTGEVGYCKCSMEMPISTIFEHLGEEPELVPSGTVFTLGCNLTCKHCQNWTISQWFEDGTFMEPAHLAKAIEGLHRSGCRNLNCVGGDPGPWLYNWLKTVKLLEVNIPVVWNSNSYYSEEEAKLLAGFADIYLLDFKYGNDRCAERISSAPNYWGACTRNHLYAKRFGELIIRLLVLPDHIDCCFEPIVEWIARNLGPETRVNVMWQYRPEWRASEIPELRRRLTEDEKMKTLEIAKEKGLMNLTR